MRDRSISIDLALAFAAAFVITMAAWPRTAPRQVVRCLSADQQWHSYSLAIDDPSLKQIRQQVQHWKTPETNPAYVTAKWQMEVAEFYQNCKPCAADDASKPQPAQPRTTIPLTATISDSVITASFEMSLDEPSSQSSSAVLLAGFEMPVDEAIAIDHQRIPDEVQSNQDDQPQENLAVVGVADANYWASVRAAAIASLAAIEARSANVPIDFGSIVPAAWPPLAFHAAFFFGLAAACAYRHWLSYAPVRIGTPYREQSFRVLVRIGTFIGLIGLAIFSSVAVWI